MPCTFTLLKWYLVPLNYTSAPPEGGILFYLCSSFRPSQDIFRRIFLSNYLWQKSDVCSQASHRYAILWEAFLDSSDSYFMFADLVGFFTHWRYTRGYHKWAVAHSSSCFSCFSCWVEIKYWRRQDLLMCKHVFKKESWLKIYTFNM